MNLANGENNEISATVLHNFLGKKKGKYYAILAHATSNYCCWISNCEHLINTYTNNISAGIYIVFHILPYQNMLQKIHESKRLIPSK